MSFLKIGRCVLALCAVAEIASCGRSQVPVASPEVLRGGVSVNLAPPARLHAAAVAREEPSSMSPSVASQDLLYVSDARTVTVYSYPQGKLEGTLRHLYIAGGMCVDRKGDVFIVDDGYYKIFEYAHGGTKRLATLASATKDPVGCSIDPTTGNLAVASLGFGSAATVAIYKNARGKPTTYTDSVFRQFYFCAFDDKGNLFVDGLIGLGSGAFGLAELAKGKAALRSIEVNQYISWPGGIEWDGKYVAVGDQNSPIVYELAVKGRRAQTVGTTHMGSGAQTVKQFWIQGQTIIAPNTYIKKELRSDVLFYAYPAGGKATENITDGVEDAQGAVVSLAAK